MSQYLSKEEIKQWRSSLEKITLEEYARRLGKVLEAVWRKGATLDAWEEYFSFDRWQEAFAECGVDPAFYANRIREKDEIMPWSMISSGVTEDYLWREYQRSLEGLTTPDCRTRCNGCGANRLVGGKCDV